MSAGLRATLRSGEAVACALLGVLVCVGGCAGKPADRGPTTADLQSGVVAQVGSRPITAPMVERVLGASGGSAQEAVDGIVHDTLFAEHARAELPFHTKAAERSVLIRAMRDSLIERAAAEGPMTDAELAALTQRHWVDVDRPRSVRTVHAVVVLKPLEDPGPARAVAERIAAAVQGVTDTNVFGNRASAIKGAQSDVDVKIEALPPVAADGRTVPVEPTDPPSATFDETFARAATALTAPFELSPVVESKFGFHVILAVEIYPEKRVDEALRRELYANEAYASRSERELGPLLTQLKASTPVEIARNADQLTLEGWTPQ